MGLIMLITIIKNTSLISQMLTEIFIVCIVVCNWKWVIVNCVLMFLWKKLRKSFLKCFHNIPYLLIFCVSIFCTAKEIFCVLQTTLNKSVSLAQMYFSPNYYCFSVTFFVDIIFISLLTFFISLFILYGGSYF